MKREAKFSIGQKVRIVRLLDKITITELIGKEGIVTEVDPLPKGDLSYYVSGRYMHEEELKAVE